MKKYAIRAMLAVCALVATTPIFALPGFKPYISDRSGEYVYYRDYTFYREAYLGFLSYDDATFGARYYAPANIAEGLLEESILIYFSVDPSLPYLKMTGERIATAVTPEQTDIVNYLHDMIYEFNSRRIKAGDVSPNSVDLFGKKSYRDSGLSISQDYPQFGGDVRVLFDYLVPLFNIKKITSNDNKILLEIITTGLLRSSDDNSFTSFSGTPTVTHNGGNTWRANLKAEKKKYATPDGQHITLDSDWANPMENLWMLGNEALLSMSTGVSTVEQTLRMTMQNADWQNISLSKNGDSYNLNSIYYQPDSKVAMRSFRVITDKKNARSIFLLTVFNNVYEMNRSYFDGIAKSYLAE